MIFPTEPETSDTQQAKDAFKVQASASEVTVLHCRIPTRLHRRLRYLTIDDGTSVTAEAVRALEMYLASLGR